MEAKVILITGASSGFGRITAEILAEAGHIVYASMRGMNGKNAEKAQEIKQQAEDKSWQLYPIELDVTSEESANNAAKRIIEEQNRINVVVNNAGMLVVGVTEAFTPEQMLQVFNTNAVSWLIMGRAFLPQMRKQEDGLIVYVGSVTSRILSPFQGPYVASKAASDVLAEVMHYENTRYGIDTVIVQPGAYTSGTSHFAHAVQAKDEEVTAEYDRINDLPPKLADRLDDLIEPGTRSDIAEVAEKIRDVIAQPKGQRPFRIVVDPEHHGAAEINEVAEKMQRNFMQRFGIEDLMQVG